MLRILSFAVVSVVVFATGAQSVVAQDALSQLSGSWSYRSFFHDPIKVESGEVPAGIELATPWAPKGQLELKVAADGKVGGFLHFGPATLDINGNAKVDEAGRAKITAEATMKDPGGSGKVVSTFRISGYLIDAKSPVIVGTVVLASGTDLGKNKQPVGTAGPFIASIDK